MDNNNNEKDQTVKKDNEVESTQKKDNRATLLNRTIKCRPNIHEISKRNEEEEKKKEEIILYSNRNNNTPDNSCYAFGRFF